MDDFGTLLPAPFTDHLAVSPSRAPDSPGWDCSDLTDAQISECVAGLAGRLNAATCEWLGYVAEADRRGCWSGFASCAAWLSWRCGIGLGTATDQIRVARALVDLPVVRSSFASGALSYSQVRALIRGAQILAEGELVELARHATGAQLERLIRGLRGAMSADAEDAAASRQRAHWHVDDDGSLVVSARLTGEWAEAWMAAIEQAEAQARAQTGGVVSQAAVIATIAGRALSAPRDADAPETTVGVVADVDALVAAAALAETTNGLSAESDEATEGDSGLTGPVLWSTTGAPASITTLATLITQAQIDLIARLADGTLVDLGRSRRRPTPRLARSVLRRHGYRCAHPHCRARAHIHLHHVRPWSRGGPTSADNLIPLCGRHHRSLHRGEFVISTVPHAKGAARFAFTGPTGRSIMAVAWSTATGTPLTVDPHYTGADRTGRTLIDVARRAERFSMSEAVGILLNGYAS